MKSAIQLLRTATLTIAWLFLIPALVLLLSVLVPVVPWLRIYASGTVPRYTLWLFVITYTVLMVALLAHAVRKTPVSRSLIGVGSFAVLAAGWVMVGMLRAAAVDGATIDLVEALGFNDANGGAPDASWQYARAGDEKLMLDVYQARTDRPGMISPAMVVVHGGGFVGGSRSVGAINMRWFADHGLTVISVDYRLAQPGRPTWQTAPADVKCALAWVARNAASLKIDPNRIMVSGASAGGTLAMRAAYAANAPSAASTCGAKLPRIAAVVARAPLIDAAAAWNHPGEMQAQQQFYLRSYIGGSPAEFPARYASLEFRRQIRPSNPPTLILGGQQDPLVPAAGAADFTRDANAAGLSVRHLLFPYSGHDFNMRFGSITNQAVLQIVLNFARENVGVPMSAPVLARTETPAARS